MEDKKAKQLYQSLKRDYATDNPTTVDSLESRIQNILQQMVSHVEKYEVQRAERIQLFKDQIVELMEDYWEGHLKTQLEEIRIMRDESKENWREIEPRMEALTQIKSIYRQSFGSNKSSK